MAEKKIKTPQEMEYIINRNGINGKSACDDIECTECMFFKYRGDSCFVLDVSADDCVTYLSRLEKIVNDEYDDRVQGHNSRKEVLDVKAVQQRNKARARELSGATKITQENLYAAQHGLVPNGAHTTVKDADHLIQWMDFVGINQKSKKTFGLGDV